MKSRRSSRLESNTRVPERRLMTVVMADVVSSTQLLVHGGDAEFVELMKAFMQLAESVIRSCGGVVQTFVGDGFMATFPTPSNAVDFAVAFQEKIHGLRMRHELSGDLRIRIGIATGEMLVVRNHVVGSVVNLAARLAGPSGREGIFLDEATVALLDSQRRAHVSAQRDRELKGLGRLQVYSYALEARGGETPDKRMDAQEDARAAASKR